MPRAFRQLAPLAAISLVVPAAIAQNLGGGFVLDKSRPFAYLAFDHIGTAKPNSDGDSPKRIYLRIVNNCQIPLVLKAQREEGQPEAILEDEVLPVEQYLRLVSPEDLAKEDKNRAEALKHKP